MNVSQTYEQGVAVVGLPKTYCGNDPEHVRIHPRLRPLKASLGLFRVFLKTLHRKWCGHTYPISEYIARFYSSTG
jgi:hypothetical protein